jgi:archaellum component FlaD/FlaE
MELNDKVTQLEDEIKILKNEVQSVLLDLRESFLKNENPFNTNRASQAAQPIIINQQAPVAVEEPPAQIEKNDDEISAADDGLEPPGEEQEGNSAPQNTDGELPPEGPVTENDDSPSVPEEPPVPEQEASITEKGKTVTGPEPDRTEEPFKDKKPAREEVEMAWQSAAETVAQFKPRESNGNGKDKYELDTINDMAQWVDECVTRLGHNRTRSILNILETIGYVNSDLKNLMVRFTGTDKEGAPEATALDYLIVLTELQRLMGREDRANEISLLYILCKENDNR